ncbi:MAG: TIGR02281 family clan AA aspartic protease [Gammaproteobacteria bacterium]|nr:MAG: TIGR02281 family clan AA aspartic protease [Gammaproteobacteria bacterium]
MRRHILIATGFIINLNLLIPCYAIDKVEVQGLFSGKAVLLVDDKRHIVAEGEQTPEGVKVISADSKSAVLEINGEQKRYPLGNSISTSYKKAASVKEQLVADDAGMFFTYGSINGHSVRFLVDTGATSIAMSSLDAKRLGIQYRLTGKPSRASTASGIAETWEIQLKTVKVGRLVQRNVDAVVINGNHPREVLLGMTFLDRLKVQKEGNKMILEMQQ